MRSWYLDIKDQLKNGIKFLEIRLETNEDNEIYLCHVVANDGKLDKKGNFTIYEWNHYKNNNYYESDILFIQESIPLNA